MQPHLYVDISATHQEVTGSCIFSLCSFPTEYRDCEKVRFLVDCGLFQEKDYEAYNTDFPFNPTKLDFVLVTHNHLDHIGRLPLLVRKGYNKPIYVNSVNRKFISVALLDNLKIMEANERFTGIPALYNKSDIDKVLSLIVEKDYNTEFTIYESDNGNIKACFLENGHILGASMIFVKIHPNRYPASYRMQKSSNNREVKNVNFLFTGDYNNKNSFVDIPNLPKEVLNTRLIIVQESTYGYMDSTEVKKTFADNILKALSEGKSIVNCAYAQGRAQELLLALRKMQDAGFLYASIPIYLDGKLAFKYTDKYLDLIKEDDGTLSFKEDSMDFLPYNLKRIRSKEERANLIANINEPSIVITTSGDGSHGPANEYIRQLVSNPKVALQFTGYTPKFSVGQQVKDSSKDSTVEISGVMKTIEADILSTNEFSVHAKADELIDFLKQFNNIEFVLVNHGNTDVKDEYGKRVMKEINCEVGILNRQTVFRFSALGLEKTLPTKFFTI